MAQFLFLYRGPAQDMSTVTPEQFAAEMAEWNTWMDAVGDSLTDGGNPVVAHANVTSNGGGTTTDVNGYSIVEAEDLAGAREFLKDHPHLKNPGNSVDVLEVMPPQMD
ncbi:MAG: YciI family protein [Bauldia sp.]